MTRPQRIQLRRVKGWRKPLGTINVARPTKWGNPFPVGAILDACWCPLDQPCHADALLDIANGDDR